MVREPHHEYCGAPASNRGHISRVLLCTMDRRLPRHSKLPASARISCSRRGECMEPKSPIKSRDLTETLLPTVLYPADTEDCFELACEADEFGVHVLDHPDDK